MQIVARTGGRNAMATIPHTPEQGVTVMRASESRTHWTVEHPEVPARVVVAARTEDEARALAWHRWYGREPTTEFDERLRAAFSVTDSGEVAE